MSFVVVLCVALVVAVAERRCAVGRRGRHRRRSAVLSIGLVAACRSGWPGPIGQTQIAAVQGNVPGEGMDAFAERRAVLHNHAEATRDFAAQVEAGDSSPRPTS